MALTNNLTSFSSLWLKLPQQKIAQAMSLLLLLYIAFIAAKITWLLVPEQQTNNSIITSNTVYKKPTTSSYNLSALEELNLFGQYNKQTEEVTEQIQNAPKTRLQLILSAAVASDSVEAAAAIIENKGKQETYGIGDIIVGTRATLEQVLIDRVIIKQSGRLETLMLDGADYNQPAKGIIANQQSNKAASVAPKKVNIVDQRLNQELSRNALQLRRDLSSDPGKITDYLRISPARKNGRLVGYKLSAGKKPDFFKLSGLKAGDVAVQMNGYDLLAPIEAAQAMSALKTERDISLLVERNNNLVEILFSID